MLKALKDLPDYQLAEGEPDVRGWPVFDQSGRQVGNIQSLIVDTDENKVRYLCVDVQGTNRMIPIGQTELDESAGQARLRPSAWTEIGRYPEYQAEIGPERERQYYTTFFPEEKELSYRRPEFEAESNKIRLLEERLRVGKREEQVGEAVARKRIEEHPEEETVELRKEHVTVERHPVDKPLAETQYAATEGRGFSEGEEIRMPITEERAVVEKQPYVKEEVVMRKETMAEPQTVREKVREEEVEFVGTEPEGRAEEQEGENQSLGDQIKRGLGLD